MAKEPRYRISEKWRKRFENDLQPTQDDWDEALEKGVITKREYDAGMSEEKSDENILLTLEAMVKIGVYEEIK